VQIDVNIINPKKTVFKGKADSIIVPGEGGVFEVLPFHKRFVSRLISGVINLDGKELPIKRGILKVDQNLVTVIIEET
jgi:F0F1-type ATP synthase epsilon subunit